MTPPQPSDWVVASKFLTPVGGPCRGRLPAGEEPRGSVFGGGSTRRCLLIFNWLWARKHAKPLRADFGLWRESAWLDWPHCGDTLVAHAAGPSCGDPRLPRGGGELRVGCLAWRPGRGGVLILSLPQAGEGHPEAEGASEARTPGGEGKPGFRAGSLPTQGCGEGQLHRRRAFGQQKSPALLPELWNGGGGLASPPPLPPSVKGSRRRAPVCPAGGGASPTWCLGAGWRGWGAWQRRPSGCSGCEIFQGLINLI